MKTYRSSSSKETQNLGEAFAKKFARGATGRKKLSTKGALVLALQGELGAGKTTFVQGFLKGLGLKKRAQSPTFIIMRRHKIARGKFKNIFHIDAYRLKAPKQLASLGFHEILMGSKNVILVEWPERVSKILPKNTAWISFKHTKKEHERTITY